MTPRRDFVPTITSPVILPRDASDEQILGVVRAWCHALAEEDYETAVVMTRHKWPMTPQLMQQSIQGYGDLEPPVGSEVFKVTSLSTATHLPGTEPVHEVHRFHPTVDGFSFGHVWFDLPLNGTWSDLTATFDILAVEEGLVLSLVMIHVM